MKALRIYVKGTVQGVGFRPFVYRLAKEGGFSGYVRNTPYGVEIHIQGENGLEIFLERLKCEKPVNARIDEINYEEAPLIPFDGFVIERTREGESTVFAPPDLFTCVECEKELFDPLERRFLYPFINCTNCGPRYKETKALPYDREKTTMKIFEMCELCRKEYEDPLNRRFHAEPNACPTCGPSTYFIENGRVEKGGIDKAVKKVKEGKVLALKGLGGFHLICDPFNYSAVERLRKLKRRERKPFALMARDIEVLKEIAEISEEEFRILSSPQRPIVLLKKKKEIPGISPGIDTYGIMLPYTPLHLLFMKEIPLIIATSANLRESPIIKDESEELNEMCDCILSHNREIWMRCDDSVLKVFDGEPIFIRRARGYIPNPIILKGRNLKDGIIALGGELKNTISILKDGYIITSQYLGDMKDYRNMEYLEEIIEHFSNLYSFRYSLVACDLHPDFVTTRLAERMGVPVFKVQHHIAHVFAVLAEYGIDPFSDFLGVSFDGMGYGEDGNIWGGEFFAFKNGKRLRRWHLKYVPQPGGDLAVKEPWRMALSYMISSKGEIEKAGILKEVEEEKIEMVIRAIKKGINSPLTSSAGRLFDAVSALIGVSPLKIDYEAEPAMRLESIAEDIEISYPFKIGDEEIDTGDMVIEILRSKDPPERIAGRFHYTLASIIKEIALRCKERYGITRVILSGGVFLNTFLLSKVKSLLQHNGFEVYYPVKFSPGDEAISVGQIAFSSFLK